MAKEDNPLCTLLGCPTEMATACSASMSLDQVSRRMQNIVYLHAFVGRWSRTVFRAAVME